MPELFGILSATLLSLAILSRVWDNTFLFRLAEHLLLGLLSGYVAAIVVRTVLWPRLILPLWAAPLAQAPLLLPLLLILLLALRLSPQPAPRSWGMIPVSLLLGIGGALALAGALRGTLIPQLLVADTLSLLPSAPAWLDTLSVIAATLTTIVVLLYIHQGTALTTSSRLQHPLNAAANLGRIMLMLAVGGLLASTVGARLTLLIDRVLYFTDVWGHLLHGG